MRFFARDLGRVALALIVGTRLMDGSIWRDHEGVVAPPGSPEELTRR